MSVDEAYKEANKIIWGAVKGSLRMLFEVVGALSIIVLASIIAADELGLMEVQIKTMASGNQICQAAR